jgi:hypothetical protein
VIFTIYKLNNFMLFATPVLKIDAKDEVAAWEYCKDYQKKLNDGYNYSHYKPSDYNTKGN